MTDAKNNSRIRNLWQILKKTAKEWNAYNPFRQSATVAYYAIFSIPALLVIVVACAGFAFGTEAVRGQISTQISSALGVDAAEQIESIIANAGLHNRSSLVATIISIVTLILGSTGVFGQLQTSLNEIWEVKPAPTQSKKKWLKMLRDRLLSFGLVLSIGFLLLVSLSITALLSALSSWIQQRWPDITVYLFELINFSVSLGIFTILFALMFKLLPDIKIKWKDVWIGAIVTALLFMLGKFGMGIYFGKANPASTYGAAGSIILLMLWVSYSCMILFFGAQFTKQHSLHFGRGVVTADYAVKTKEVVVK